MDGLYPLYDNHGMRFALIEGGDLYIPRRAAMVARLAARTPDIATQLVQPRDIVVPQWLRSRSRLEERKRWKRIQ
jgi:hypothetical protein